ncbi:hypothetical protein E2C01_000268 [Portunus trituberculatus]|uniref:Uncharacterized protein n=1 Tax=Portunus trituberculatus TaxID=210409 RepID=A0A5B7CJ67_PORTR|nr:hypothetical protein [Portunus trituberculatus]
MGLKHSDVRLCPARPGRQPNLEGPKISSHKRPCLETDHQQALSRCWINKQVMTTRPPTISANYTIFLTDRKTPSAQLRAHQRTILPDGIRAPLTPTPGGDGDVLTRGEKLPYDKDLSPFVAKLCPSCWLEETWRRPVPTQAC